MRQPAFRTAILVRMCCGWMLLAAAPLLYGADAPSERQPLTLSPRPLPLPLLYGDDAPPEPKKVPAGDAPAAAQRVIEGMAAARQRLEQNQLDEETRQTQQNVLEDLDQLLEMAGRQESQQKSLTPMGSTPEETTAPQPQPAGDEPADGHEGARGGDGSPVSRSTERMGAPQSSAADRERRRAMATSVWGHLPPRVQDEMQRSFSERYLPKYDDLVRRYY